MTKDEVVQQLSELQEKIKTLPDDLDILSVELYKFRCINEGAYSHNVILHDSIEKMADIANVSQLNVYGNKDEIQLSFSANGLVFAQTTRRTPEEAIQFIRRWS